MNKLFTILMCFQLVLAPVAFGADAPPKPATVEAPVNTSYDKTQGGTGGYDFYVNQILVLSIGIMGSNIITSCPRGLLTPSIPTYMGGSLAYIISEMAAASAENDRHKKALSDIEMVEAEMPKQGGELQLAAIQASLDSERKLLDYVENKRNWMIAITALFTAAMGIAISEEIRGISLGVAAAAAACPPPATAANCAILPPVGVEAAKAAFTLPDGDVIAFNACNAGIGCQAYAKAYMAVAYAHCSPLKFPIHKTLNWVLVTGISVGYGILVGQMGGGAISTYGSMIASLLPLISDKVTGLITATYSYPIPRSITFGASAALGGVVLTGLQQRVDAAKGNIKKLEKVIAEWTMTTAGPGGLTAGTGNGSDGEKAPPPKAGEVDRLATGITGPRACMGKSQKFGASECKDSMKLKKANFDFGDGLSTLQTASRIGTDMANASAAGDTGKANALVGQVGSLAGRIKATTDKLKKKYNALLVAEGKAPVDFDKSVKEQVASLQNTINEAAASQGFSPSGMASLDSNPENKNESPKDKTKTAAGGGAAGAPGMDSGLESEGDLPADKIAASGDGIDKFVTAEADISKQKDISIFLQLSNRYILNYGKIFDKKIDQQPPLAAPPATPATK
ncbi:MAG TPA: hypothetical protein VNJ08_12105 [Bacteriovoracaceae bacterium]|nr:hypothetical protein [Bacteriovoracaceae bacterium]